MKKKKEKNFNIIFFKKKNYFYFRKILSIFFFFISKYRCLCPRLKWPKKMCARNVLLYVMYMYVGMCVGLLFNYTHIITLYYTIKWYIHKVREPFFFMKIIKKKKIRSYLLYDKIFFIIHLWVECPFFNICIYVYMYENIGWEFRI